MNMKIDELKKDKENEKNRQQKKFKIILFIIGVVLVFSALRSVYYTYKKEKSYELKGWQTETSTCTNPRNPYEAETCEGINIETKIAFFIGLICIFNHFILKFTNTKKINEIRYKILRMTKRNIIKIVTVLFWCHLGTSLILVLKEVFWTPNWNQIVTQYYKLEIILECFIYIVSRCGFKKSTSYFNIFWI